MGFLKKSKVPSELPDLAIGKATTTQPVSTPTPTTAPSTPAATQTTQTIPQPTQSPPTPQPITATQTPAAATPTQPAMTTETPTPTTPNPMIPTPDAAAIQEHGEAIKQHIHEHLGMDEEDPESFIDTMLQDINGEMDDLGKLEKWYQNKFQTQDVVSNMRDYWEDNKAGMIIRSFGSDYKKKINEHGRRLQELEGDWRELYFKLIKKEEEMKREERILKETLSEFVELCKRRKLDSDGKEEDNKDKENKE